MYSSAETASDGEGLGSEWSRVPEQPPFTRSPLMAGIGSFRVLWMDIAYLDEHQIGLSDPCIEPEDPDYWYPLGSSPS